MQQRFEHKYLMSEHVAAVLKQRAKLIMQPDPNANGPYIVNNLYLDDRYDNFYYHKVHGRVKRDKFRLRHYNGDCSFIRLERKHRDGNLIYKDTMQISHEQYNKIKEGDLKFILQEEAPLWQMLGILYRLRGLRPTALFEYRREAFVYAPGNVRFTFDSPPFNSGSEAKGYDPLSIAYGKEEYSPLLLEVKYTDFLPDVIKGLLNGLPLTHTSMSKYCLVRERGYLTHARAND